MTRKASSWLGAAWNSPQRRETISTFVMGIAAVMTTWCAFEGARWGGIQTIRFNEAAAARVESTRHELAANQIMQVDIATFLAWVQAVQQEHGSTLQPTDGPYVADPATVSGFLFKRFRPEFQPVVESWVETRPMVTESAPRTPFLMEEYKRPLLEKGQQLEAAAEEKAKAARQANSNSNNYMFITVLAALVMFFAGLSPKVVQALNGIAMLLLAVMTLIICFIVLLRLPVILL